MLAPEPPALTLPHKGGGKLLVVTRKGRRETFGPPTLALPHKGEGNY